MHLGFDVFEARIKKNDKKGLIFVSNDGSKRMYRNLEKRLIQNPGRFFPIVFDCDSVELGRTLLKKDVSVKFLYVEGEDMFERILLGFSQ